MRSCDPPVAGTEKKTGLQYGAFFSRLQADLDWLQAQSQGLHLFILVAVYIGFFQGEVDLEALRFHFVYALHLGKDPGQEVIGEAIHLKKHVWFGDA